MIQKIEVLVADVDMTLSSKGSPLPEITIQALKELHDKNVKIGLATGREITETEKTKGIFWNLGFEFDFVIGMNGGMIYDRNLNKSFTMDMLSVKEMKEVLTFLMPIILEKKVSVNVEGNQLRNVMNISDDLLDMAKRKIFYLSIRQVILMVFVKNLFISSYLGQTQKQRNLSVIK